MAAEDKAAVNNPGGAGAAPALSELKRLGKYEIEKKIGAGGMGAVFLARDTELKRTVALKVLPRDKAENPTLVKRFRAEAQAAAQLRHPNIVAVYDSGEADGYLYIAMEYVEGQDLFEMVTRRGNVPIRRSIDIIKQIASALQHAYEQNIVHRDIKPSNLLIRRDGVVKLTDLGLARSVDDTLETNITRAGTTVGTVDYMSPEQARNSKLADIRSDLYSLGCTWYQMLTGSPPYPEGSVTNKLQSHAVKPVPDPRDKNSQVPEGLTAVILRMMAKKPEDRYQTPAELIDELNHAKLTQASIAREIFADDSSSEIDSVEEEALSDDGYFDMGDVKRDQETPDQVPTRSAAPAPRKKTRQTTTGDDEVETEDGTEDSSSRSRPSKKSRPEPGTESKPHRSAQTDDDDDDPDVDESDEPEATSSKSKPRSSKGESKDASAPTGKSSESKGKPAKGTESKGNDSKGTKPKPSDKPGQKPMPPKRQPIEVEGAESSGFSKELRKYVAAGGGLVLVIATLGWLFSGFGNNVAVDKNPFQTPPATTDPVAPAVAVINPGAVPGTPENPSVTVANNPAGKPENIAGPGNSPSFDVERIPDWAAKSSDTASLQVLTVGPGAKSATHFDSLDEALAKVPTAGAVIKLLGAGPFLLSQVELSKIKRIVLTAGSLQDRPAIALKPAADQTSAGLRVRDGIVELRGLHFTVDRQVVPGSTRIVEVIDGQLSVHQCSFTSKGTSGEPLVALSVQSAIDSTSVPLIEPNLLLDRVLVRGDGLTGLSVRRANTDAVLQDCLMASGKAPVIEIAGHIAAGVSDVATTKPRRVVRILRSTLSAQNRIFDVSVSESGKPPQTAMLLRDSLCTAQGVVANSAIVFAGQWPQVRSSNESWLTRMNWISTNSLYLGFEQFVDLGSSFKVVDATTWQRVWNVRTDARQFQKLTFPETAIEDLSLAQPQDFDTVSFSFREVKGADGSLPGCQIAKLLAPDATSLQRVGAFTNRPSLPPAAIKSADPTQVRKIDLKKEDLGLALNKSDWPSGTLFEASGGGLCFMTPAKIDGRSFRIHFRQTDGASLKIQPLQPKSGDTSKNVPLGLIAVTGATMELTNAVLEGHPNAKGMHPEWLIHATNATVILNGCRLLGSEADGTRQVGLIGWNTTAPAGTDQVSLVVRDSYLAGSGSGIRAECAHGTMILRNSILAMRGDAIDLRPLRSGNGLLPVLDGEGLTISATGAAVRFEAAPGSDPVTTPCKLFMERSVVAPPLAFKSGEATNSTLLQCVGPVVEQNQLEWWGASNGVARQVAHMIRRDGDTGAGSDERTGLTAWKKLWDKASSLRLLTGDKGVYLAGELPVRWKDLKPSSFSLHKNSQASSWADGGRPIGANTTAVEESSIARKAGETSKPPIVPNTSKKNVGF